MPMEKMIFLLALVSFIIIASELSLRARKA
jgi:hypothetical protein